MWGTFPPFCHSLGYMLKCLPPLWGGAHLSCATKSVIFPPPTADIVDLRDGTEAAYLQISNVKIYIKQTE